jgi:flavin-dependent dehydrogenase
LVADLLKGAEVLSSPVPAKEFDRIIDATGFSRTFLPTICKDIISNCVQYRVSSGEKYEIGIDISNLGYAWRFPMSNNEYHIGAGSIMVSPQRMLEKLGWLKNSFQICACSGKIRLTAPQFSLPFVDMKNDGQGPIWGVGEAIGCVAPLVGEGIIPGLKSAELLLANWEDPKAYERAILKEFSWMEEERKIVDKAARGKRMGLFDARILNNSTRRFGMNLDYNQGLTLLKGISKMG